MNNLLDLHAKAKDKEDLEFFKLLGQRVLLKIISYTYEQTARLTMSLFQIVA